MLERIVKQLADRLIPVIGDAITAEIKRQMPTLIKAVVLAITETMGNLAVRATDQVTDIIPGELDDRMVDGFVVKVFDHLHRLGV